MGYKFNNDTKIMSGENALENIGYEIRRCGCRHPMLITDEICKRLGYLKTFLRAFDNGDIAFGTVFDGVLADADGETCEKLFNLYTVKECDCIVALGRENVLTAAKIVRLMIKEKVPRISQFLSAKIAGAHDKDVPLFVVPVISACGGEATGRCELTDELTNTLYTFNSASASVTAVIIDYRMTDIIPPATIAKSALYALTVGVLAYLGNEENTIASVYASVVVRDITENIKTMINRNGSRRYRTRLMKDVVVSGIPGAGIKAGLSEQLAFGLSGSKGLSRSDMSVALMPAYASKCNEERLSSLLLYLVGEEEYCMCAPMARAKKAVAVLENLYKEMSELTKVKLRLSEYGIQKADFTEVASYVLQDKANAGVDMSYLLDILERSY